MSCMYCTVAVSYQRHTDLQQKNKYVVYYSASFFLSFCLSMEARNSKYRSGMALMELMELQSTQPKKWDEIHLSICPSVHLYRYNYGCRDNRLLFRPFLALPP